MKDFDNIPWTHLNEILSELDIDDYLKHILISFMWFYPKTGLKQINIYKGFPQGSYVGPLLCLRIADKILQDHI